ncbi:MAG: phenylglyoxylate dehydrogenase [Chloroflexota bacterium]
MIVVETRAPVRHKVTAVTGLEAAAHAVRLARVPMLSGYPITPQTYIIEYLTGMIDRGELDATFIPAESEHAVMSFMIGASLAGSRTFTATTGQGLAYMYEPYFLASTLRVPVVMAIAMREMIGPSSGFPSHQDIITVRDAGWVQLYVEDNQEVLDTTIMAFKIAEHPDVLLPVNVCFDGFYVSYSTARVEIPEQAAVDGFLPPYRPTHISLDPQLGICVNNVAISGQLVMEYRHSHAQGMESAKRVINEVDEEFGRVFGWRYGGLLEKYRLDDADLVLVTMAGICGTARAVVDQARERGLKLGLLKLRSFRPFPAAELRQALEGKAAAGVIDRNLSFGWGAGVVHTELRAALLGAAHPPHVVGFIAGLGGLEITLDQFDRAIDVLQRAAAGQSVPQVTWLGMEGGK